MRNSSPRPSSSGSFRPSRYNVTVVLPGGEGLLFNTLTGARIHAPAGALTPEQVAALEKEEWPADVALPGPHVLDALFDNQFLVRREIDELQVYLERRSAVMYNPALRRVSVILTRRCNLGCVYCYQDKDLGDSKTEPEQILRYLKSQIVPGGSLQVTWFGGEPMLRFSLICELSDQIIAACREHGTSYEAAVSTNGVLLDAARIDELVKRRITRYQISLDGPAEIQEVRRPSLVRKPTYETILENIRLLLDRGAEVRIKVILDRDNHEAVPSMFRELRRRGLLSSVKIAIQHTEAKFAAAEYDKRFASLEEFARVKLRLLDVLAGEGYHLSDPSLRPEFCSATSPHATQVDMIGNAFRCGTEMENLTGRISEEGDEVVLTRPQYEEMFTKRRFSHDECESCKVLPVCGGGCTVGAEGLAERDVCSFFKVALKDYLIMLDRQDRAASPAPAPSHPDPQEAHEGSAR